MEKIYLVIDVFQERDEWQTLNFRIERNWEREKKIPKTKQCRKTVSRQRCSDTFMTLEGDVTSLLST